MKRIDVSIGISSIAGLAAVAMTLYAIVDGQMLWAGVFLAETVLGWFVSSYYSSKREESRTEAPE